MSFVISKANEFRSKVIMDIGAPYEIPVELYDMYKKNKKEAVAILLEQIEQVKKGSFFIEIYSIFKRLKSCLITAPSYSYLSAIFTMRNIYKPDNIKLTGEKEFNLNRRFALGVEFLKNHPDIEKAIERCNIYRQKLEDLGIKDEEVINYSRKYLRDLISIMKSLSLWIFNAAFVNF